MKNTMKKVSANVLAVLALCAAPLLHAQENEWLSGDPSEEIGPSPESDASLTDQPGPLWRCDAAPSLYYGLTTYWIHSSPLVACQIAVGKCQQINGVPCVYRYYRIQ